MLTSSSNQYLRPEYLTPLPTTLDAKKSPLALLAQTCSQIGADPLPPSSSSGSSSGSKGTSSLLSSLHDVSGTGSNSVGSSSTSSTSSMSSNSNSITGSTTTNNSTNPTANSGSNSKKSKSSHHHLNVGVEHHQSHHHRKSSGASPKGSSGKQEKQLEKETRFTPPLLASANAASNNSSGRNSTSPHEKAGGGLRVKTPSNSGSKVTASSPLHTTTATNPSPRDPANKSPVTSSTGLLAPTSTSSTPTNSASADAILSSKASARDSPAILRSSPAFPTSSNNSAPGALCPPLQVSSASKLNLNGPLGCDSLSLSSLKSGHGGPLPFPGLYPGLTSHAATMSSATTTAGLPPYLHSYARLKAAAAANGTDHLAAAAAAAAAAAQAGGGGSGGCRDPFCTGCQLGAPHLPSSLKSCPAGCLQCDHHKSPFFNVNGCSTTQGFPFLPGFSIPPGFYSSAMAANSSASHSQQPYVCNWIVGDTYCGKRFTSSDELLQHLRSHTSLSSAAAAAGQSNPDPLAAAYSQHPLFSGMNMNLNLSRTYPTPPLSPLSSARFHPYSKPGGGLGGLSGLPNLNGINLPGSAAAAAAAAAGLSSFNPPAGFSSLSHPLSPYYPYAAFYGQRLGSSSILHP